MSAAERKETIVKLSGSLQKSTSLFRKQTTEADKVMHASYEVFCLLARQVKPFTDRLYQGVHHGCDRFPVLKSILPLKVLVFHPALFVIALRCQTA